MNATDRVLTVNDYYDGPRLGVAELNGVPHIYEREFDADADEYENTYFLSPIASDLLALVLEDWEIWLRWEAEFKAGRVEQDTHPALPTDRLRHDHLASLIGEQLTTDPKRRQRYKAKFAWSGSGAISSWYGVRVSWLSPHDA
jgi:hypothetical protein